MRVLMVTALDKPDKSISESQTCTAKISKKINFIINELLFNRLLLVCDYFCLQLTNIFYNAQSIQVGQLVIISDANVINIDTVILWQVSAEVLHGYQVLQVIYRQFLITG